MRMGKIVKEVGVLVALFITGIVVWPFIWPYIKIGSPEAYVVAMRRTKGNDGATRAVCVDRLVAMGLRAIRAVIEAIRTGGTRSRRTWQLNSALSGLGEPAHRQLIAAIDQETDPGHRIHPVDSLQQVFGDFNHSIYGFKWPSKILTRPTGCGSNWPRGLRMCASSLRTQ